MIGDLRPYQEMKDSGVAWLGEIPGHWEAATIRRYCRVFSGATPDRANPDYWQGGDIPWLASGDVNRRRIYEANQFITDAGFAASSTKWIRPGSLVVALAGQGRTKGMVADVEFPATCNQSLAAIEPSLTQSSSRFLGYYLECRYRDLRALVGDGLRDGLNLEHVRSIWTPLPPLEEQAAIVRFLDHADAPIRRYVGAKQQVIKLLEEQKQAIIHRAVTRGLDPNVTLKPSGVDWLDGVPAHWEVARLKTLIARVTSGSRGWSQFAADSGPMFIRIGNLTRASIGLKLEDVVRLDLPSEVLGEAARARVQPGDILLSITAYIGSVAVVPPHVDEAYVSQHVACCRPRPGAADPRWLAYVLLSEVGQAHGRLSMYGGTKQGLSLDDVRNYVLLLPPHREQLELVSWIDRAVARIEVAIAGAMRELELIREYRARLIADVVTGKLDVREVSARLPHASGIEEVGFGEGLGGGSADPDNLDGLLAEVEA